ncbi:DEAD/DEAH box helicase family protein [Candidatus Woesearchaeota archaeon]|nr:DEAD/DEAH box helicase family protein [Candidatus Woesearchaeota archaeon]
MIKNFLPRLYQQTIFATACEKNTLIVLPTGLGKTNIFLMVAAHRLKVYPEGKIVLLGPTKPLIDQYAAVFEQHFDIPTEFMARFTGEVAPEKREEIWKNAKIIFSTPQGLENDVISNRIKLDDIVLLGVDEAHRTTGEYSYAFLASEYLRTAKHPRIVAMTASPGSEKEKITEVCTALGIEEIEIRDEEDPDVKPYIQEVSIETVKVDLPPSFREVYHLLEDCYKAKLADANREGNLNISPNFMSKRELLGIQAQLFGELAQGNKSPEMLKSVSLLAEAMKIQHAIELLETQGIASLTKYFEKMMKDAATSKTKAVQNLMRDLRVRTAMVQTKHMLEAGVDHPKLAKLQGIIEQEMKVNNQGKVIVFTQYRDTGVKIRDLLKESSEFRPVLFVGQAKKGDTGLTQKKQLETIEKFKHGEHNVLIATSVAEEGLDIPQVDLIVFYEPVPSAIRQIQRRGRTGRHSQGKVIMLVAKNTRDEAYKWVAFHKEKRMKRIVDEMRDFGKMLGKPKERQQTTLVQDEMPVTIVVDHREKSSRVLKELMGLSVKLKLETLDSGDYVLSRNVAVEYKTKEDFVNSIIDGRLLQQIKELKRNFLRPIVLVEGEEDIYSVRRLHANALRGAIAAIMVSFHVPVLFTRTPQETAAYLHLIAKREQDATGRDFNAHGSRKPMTLAEQQEYLVSSIPGVGPKTARDLLLTLGSVRKIIDADEKMLKGVEGVGEVTAKKIKEIVDGEYRQV